MDIDLFVSQSEESFGLKTDDAILAKIKTVGEYIDYVYMLLPNHDYSDNKESLLVRMLKLLSIHMSSVLECSILNVSPSTPLAELFPDTAHDNQWDYVRILIGAKYWPNIRRSTRWCWFKSKAGTFDQPLCTTVMDVALFLVARSPSLVKSDTEGWQRTEVAEVVRLLVMFTFGLPDDTVSENVRFVDDLLLE